MKSLLFVIVFYSNLSVYGQEKTKEISPPKNVYSIEMGIKSRGLIGLGYNRNIAFGASPLFLSIHASLGYGGYTPMYHATFSSSLNLGSKGRYFQFGVESKYTTVPYYENLVNLVDGNSPDTFKGPAVSGFIGSNLFKGTTKIKNVKARISYTIGFDTNENDDFKATNEKSNFTRVGIGLAFSIRNKLKSNR